MEQELKKYADEGWDTYGKDVIRDEIKDNVEKMNEISKSADESTCLFSRFNCLMVPKPILKFDLQIRYLLN